MPSTEQNPKIKSHFEILSIPHHIVKKDFSQGAKHGPTQRQYDHHKAKDVTRNARNKGHDSILLRWQDDDPHRNSQIAVGMAACGTCVW